MASSLLSTSGAPLSLSLTQTRTQTRIGRSLFGNRPPTTRISPPKRGKTGVRANLGGSEADAKSAKKKKFITREEEPEQRIILVKSKKRGHDLLKAVNGKSNREEVESHNMVSRRSLLLSGSIGLNADMWFVTPALAAGTSPEVANTTATIAPRRLNSGVKVLDVVEGTGPKAGDGDLVEFNYVCRRSNGYFVHSTIDQFTGETNPVVIPLDEKMIKGLKEVIVGMKAGGKRRALIPPNVGYTSTNLQPLPDEFGPRRSLLSHSNEPLVFEIQLLKVF